jgi:hypothetical protein
MQIRYSWDLNSMLDFIGVSDRVWELRRFRLRFSFWCALRSARGSSTP